ncbi:mannose-6-phosphate isomerase, class I [Robertmurraya sp. FSL R5-0851]|uniref:mannose-6-phosphate isomerase, class I n=1 Tax=Robertmurraya sp. FSL R5-0851 TaxID=2921584 RepID=UPI0030F8EF60
MREPIFFKPIFQERIWGGEQLTSFGYDVPSSKTGECWAFAAHENGQSIVKNGEYKGKTLGDLWSSNRELFGGIEGDRFPLLTKILDANDDLSVQVHPNDEYAYAHENGELGKTECWYIIDCKPGAEIILGHNAQSKEDFIQMIEEGKWEELLRKVPVKPGDFFFVPSGTIHAIGKGIVILETQQNSDTTYRVYDYDRMDDNGNKRELHITKSIEVSTIPHQPAKVETEVSRTDDLTVTTFVRDRYFTVQKWHLSGRAEQQQNKPFQLVSVMEGAGTLTVSNGDQFNFTKGDHFLLPSNLGAFSLEGNCECMVSFL